MEKETCISGGCDVTKEKITRKGRWHVIEDYLLKVSSIPIDRRQSAEVNSKFQIVRTLLGREVFYKIDLSLEIISLRSCGKPARWKQGKP